MKDDAKEIAFVMDEVEAGWLSLKSGRADGGGLGDDRGPRCVLGGGADEGLVEVTAEDKIDAGSGKEGKQGWQWFHDITAMVGRCEQRVVQGEDAEAG